MGTSARVRVWSHKAADNNHVEAIRKLYEAGAHLDQANEQGATALHVACDFGHLDLAKYLIEAGACLDKGDPLKFPG